MRRTPLRFVITLEGELPPKAIGEVYDSFTLAEALAISAYERRDDGYDIAVINVWMNGVHEDVLRVNQDGEVEE